jgi:hypothetical protein
MKTIQILTDRDDTAMGAMKRTREMWRGLISGVAQDNYFFNGIYVPSTIPVWQFDPIVTIIIS